MLLRSKNYLLILFLFALLPFLRLAPPSAFNIDQKKWDIFEHFPIQIKDWKGTDEALEDKIYEILETKNVLSRVYQNQEGERIHLLLVGSQQDRRVAHPPEVCFTGSHYQISKTTPGELYWQGKKVPFKEFVAQKEDKSLADQNVLYLYQVGNQWTGNYYEQQLKFAWQRLSGQKSNVLLIRLSSPNSKSFPEFLKLVLNQVSS